MFPEVIDQLATLGDLLDRAVAPVTADEVLRRSAHSPTPEDAQVALVEVRKPTTNPGHRSWKPRAVGIAASVVVLAAGTALVFHRSTPLAPGTSQTDVPTSTAVSPPTTIDAGRSQVPDGSVLRFTTELPGVGIVNVYDTADRSQVCLVVETGSGGCDDQANIESGQSWAYMKNGPDAPAILIGLTATNIGFRVTIDGTTATPDDRGLWYTIVPTGATEFTITTNRGSQAFPINGPGVPTTSATTADTIGMIETRVPASSPVGVWERLAAGPLAGDQVPAVMLAIGNELFVWGTSGAGVLDPATDRWRAAAEPPSALRVVDAAVWTGQEVLLWGGHDAAIGEPSSGAVYPDRGLAYNPVTDHWRMLAQAPIETRHPAVFAWEAGEFYVWGGYRLDGPPSGPLSAPTARVFDDAAAYNPTTDSWRTLASAVTTRTDSEPTLATGSPPLQWVTISANVDNGFGATNHLIIYDGSRDSWASEIPSPMRGWSEAGSWTPSGFVAIATSVTTNGAPLAVEAATWQPDRGWTVLTPPPVSQAILCRTQVLRTVQSAVVRRCGDLAVLEPDLTWRLLPPIAESATVVALDTTLIAVDENVQRLNIADDGGNGP